MIDNVERPLAGPDMTMISIYKYKYHYYSVEIICVI